MIDKKYSLHRWANSITIDERIKYFKLRPKMDAPNNKYAPPSKFMQFLRNQSPYNSDILFQKKLKQCNITISEFEYLINRPVEYLLNDEGIPPQWVMEFNKIFGCHDCNNDLLIAKDFNDEMAYSLLYIITPLINNVRQKLLNTATQLFKKIDIINKPADLVDLLYQNLPTKLLTRLSRTLTLELNIARLKGDLSGRTSTTRYVNFTERLKGKAYRFKIFNDYPVLARQIVILLNNWTTYCIEFMVNLYKDYTYIKNLFAKPKDSFQITKIDMGVGDTHKKGRSVIVVSFDSGLKIVYKPRSLAIDNHFQELLRWVNNKGFSTKMKTIKILDCGDYGWVEYVNSKSCETLNEVKRFYLRQGCLLALFYLLNATDLHFENIIASGKYPIPVDIESLFHPNISNAGNKSTADIVGRHMEQSVLRTGLLPQRLFIKEEYEGIDISGLNAPSGQLYPGKFPNAEMVGTDSMHFVRRQFKVPPSKNRPTLKGNDIDITLYIDEIEAGFKETFNIFIKNKKELIPLLRKFSSDEIRIILRPTRTYGLLLLESFHPDFLSDAFYRDLLLDKLWLSVESQPSLEKVIEHEKQDLNEGDIPIFFGLPKSKDLFTSTGVRIRNFIKQAPLKIVNKRIGDLNEKDLVQHIWFIRSAFATLPNALEKMNTKSYRFESIQKEIDSEHFAKNCISQAIKIGERLNSLALYSKKGAAWIGLTFGNYGQYALSPLTLDLYSGLPGIALFLAYLAHITQKEKYYELAKLTLHTIHDQLENITPNLKSIGAFNGWGGIIYLLTHLAAIWKDNSLLDEAISYTSKIITNIENDNNYDIMAGSAGCILSLISLYRIKPVVKLLNVAINCGEYLVERADIHNESAGWPSPLAKNKCLTGFSHGSSGIALALLSLNNLCSSKKFHKIALKALKFERNNFSQQEENWYDLRELTGIAKQNKNHHFMTAWCNGAPGIGLARLKLRMIIDDNLFTEEINHALKTTIKHGFGMNHCLCHGDLGNLEFLMEAERNFKDHNLCNIVSSYKSKVVTAIKKYGCVCGVPFGVETPALMVGLAGIGYGLLRLANYKRVPSVLTLDPPCT